VRQCALGNGRRRICGLKTLAQTLLEQKRTNRIAAQHLCGLVQSKEPKIVVQFVDTIAAKFVSRFGQLGVLEL
jgi:hypothetical protein